jgi:hypothetical protein
MKDKLPLDVVFKKAREIAITKELKASIILDFIVNKSRRNYLNIVFAYLRWVDDTIDNPGIPIKYKIDFISRQKANINDLLSGNLIKIEAVEDNYLYYLIQYSRENESSQLIEELKNMVEAISWDVERLKKDGIFCESDLRLYINTMAKSLYNILNIFVKPPKSYFNPNLFFGKFTANAQMLRDLLEDIEAGFINISREDIEKYKLNPLELKKDDQLKSWLKDKIKYVMQILEDETKTSWNAPLKNKIYIYWAHIYYLPKVYRPKIYNYDLEKIHNGKIVVKEFIVYMYSSLMAIRLFIKNFIISPQKT